MASESHLDAEWKRIQKKTFTRWCNEHLRVQGIQIKDISTDFSDGVCLVTLLQVLSQKKVGKYNKKPRVRAQKLENVQLSLKFIESEKIRLVNIGKMGWSVCEIRSILALRHWWYCWWKPQAHSWLSMDANPSLSDQCQIFWWRFHWRKARYSPAVNVKLCSG